MDPMDYMEGPPPGPPAHGGNFHSNPAGWTDQPQSYVPWFYNPGIYSNPFASQRPPQNSTGFPQPSFAPLQGLGSSTNHSPMVADTTQIPPDALGTWQQNATPIASSPGSQGVNHVYAGAYDGFGNQSGWTGQMDSGYRGLPLQPPAPVVGNARHHAGGNSAAARSNSLPRLQTTLASSSAGARSQPPQRSASTFSPSAAPFTPGQARYNGTQQPSTPAQNSRGSHLTRAPSYTQHQHQHQHQQHHSLSQSLERSSLPSPASERPRQRQYRARRSFGGRYTASDPLGEGSSSTTIRTNNSPNSHRRSHSMSLAALEEFSPRHIQVLRGAMTSKMVASKSAIHSLQKVDISDLAENEKSCVICYNDYGVETPEGVSEAPLRLPKCKHVFGDFCIKKWLADSDSCPYCRDKLPSEPKHCTNSARAFMNMMRTRGLDLPPADAEDLYRRILSGEDFELTSIGARPSTAERRPPPDAADEQQRRTRQRRSSVSSHDNYPLTPRNVNIQRPQMPPTPSTPRQFSPRQLELGSAANTNASLATASSSAGRTTVNQRGTTLEPTPDPAPDRRTRFLNLWQSVGPGTDGLFAAEGPLPNPLRSWGSAFSENTPRPGSATRLYSIPHYQMGSLTEPRITPTGSEDSW